MSAAALGRNATLRPLARCEGHNENGRGWFRTSDLPRVKRALSR
jgi:hypothetical protein